MNASIGHNQVPPVAGDYSELQARISTLVESFPAPRRRSNRMTWRRRSPT